MRIVAMCKLMVGMSIAGYSQNTVLATNQVPASVTLPVIALLDIEPSNGAITLALPPITEAGRSFEAVSNNAQWLNYTSVVEAVGNTRRVTAQISSGTVPPGVHLELSIGNPEGAGGGARGSSVGKLSLTNTAQTILNGIGGAFTGSGINSGHQLTYLLRVQDFGELRATQPSTVIVTYTLTDF